MILRWGSSEENVPAPKKSQNPSDGLDDIGFLMSPKSFQGQGTI